MQDTDAFGRLLVSATVIVSLLLGLWLYYGHPVHRLTGALQAEEAIVLVEAPSQASP